MGHETAARRRMSVEEFLAWDGDGEDTRFELIDGVPMAMNPPRRAHGTIVANLAAELRPELPHGCVVVVEAGIRSPTRADSYYHADLAVTCEPPRPDQHEIEAPRLLVEVLSQSTESHDRKVKLVDYRLIPSVEEVLLVDQNRPFCELHRRMDGERWLVELLVDPHAVVTLASLSVEIPLAAIYADLTFAPTDER